VVDLVVAALFAMIVVLVTVARIPVGQAGTVGQAATSSHTPSKTVIDGKFGIGVTSVTIGTTPVPGFSADPAPKASIVTSLAIHVEFAPADRILVLGPLRVCLRHVSAVDPVQPRCWGGNRLASLVNEQLGAPAGIVESWVLTSATAVRLDTVIDRDPAFCDYPPGGWTLDLSANVPDPSENWVTISAPVEVPENGPRATAGPEVPSAMACLRPLK
jgi:hypothetical protein